MPDLTMIVDTAVIVPVNLLPLLDDTDFKTRETAVAYNAAGMDLVWNFVTAAGVCTQTAVTPTTAGVYDWTHLGDGIYTIEIPASGGASINNDTEGFGWFSGLVTGVLPWRGPIIQFSPAQVVNGLVTGTDNLQVDAVQWAGAATATDDVALAGAPTNFAALSITAGGLVDITQGAADKVWSSATRTLTAFSAALALAFWDVLESAVAAASSMGLKVKTNLDAAVSTRATPAQVKTEVDTALADVNLDHLVGTATGIPAIPAGTFIDQMMDDGTAVFDRTTDSLQAIRDRGDAAWVTGGGGSISDILNIVPLIPASLDLANTATWRLGLALTNALDDLPTTAEITPGTISIERKAIGGTAWSAVVTDAACSEAAGMIYYDATFNAAAGYAEGDSIRVTFKSQSITVAANAYEISDATGRMFYSTIRQSMRGTDNAALASTAAAIQAKTDQLAFTSPGKIDANMQEWVGVAPLALSSQRPQVDLRAVGGAGQSATDLKDFADTGYDPVTHKVAGVVVTDTVTTYTGNTPQTGDNFARLGAPAGASVSADIAAVKAETASIQADTNDLQTRVPAALVGGKMEANASAIDGSAAAAANLKQSTLGIVTAVVGSGSTTTSIVTSSMSPAATVTDQFKGKIVTFAEDTTTAALRGQSTDITASTAGGVLTVTALTMAPVSGDTFAVT